MVNVQLGPRENMKISSNVPRLPGKAIKASTWLNIAFIRLFFLLCPYLLKLWGQLPKLDCLLKRQLSTHPSYTKWIFLSASTWPRWFAASKNVIFFPGLDPPKTQIFLMWWLEEPIISTHFYIWWIYGLSRNEGKEEKNLYMSNWKCNHTTYM